jgi:hypothetical protein
MLAKEKQVSPVKVVKILYVFYYSEKRGLSFPSASLLKGLAQPEQIAGAVCIKVTLMRTKPWRIW